MTAAPTLLRVEHLDVALGIDVRMPRLSWRLPVETVRQRAYRLQVGSWDSGVVESDANVMVEHHGAALRSGQRMEWRVKVWTDAGESAWSEPSWFEAGLLDATDWQTRWIEPIDAADEPSIRRPAHLMRGVVHLDRTVKQARLFMTAHGIYEPYLNGRRVGEMELTPGFTSYRHNLQVQTYDVTGMLRTGDNVLGAVVSDGWWRGQIGYTRERNMYGRSVGLLAQLHVVYDDETSTVWGTDATWTHSTGDILGADIIDGETVDFRRAEPGWSESTFDAGSWSPVQIIDFGNANLCSSPAPPVRRVEELRPTAVRVIDADTQVVNLGQNINGWIRLGNVGPEGTAIELTYGEAVDETGNVTMDHLRPQKWDTGEWLSSGQTDQVISAGDDEAFEPRHSTKGFQYVRVTGHPDALTCDDVTGIVVHTDLRRTGWFRCSDDRINRMHEAAVWSFLTTRATYPRTAPNRARRLDGGLADLLSDGGVLVRCRRLLDEVASRPRVGSTARRSHQELCPRSGVREPGRPSGEGLPQASTGWGDASVIVPWKMWQTYGDKRILATMWQTMVGWVEYAARTHDRVVISHGNRLIPNRRPMRSSSGIPASTGVSGASRVRRMSTSSSSSNRTARRSQRSTSTFQLVARAHREPAEPR